MSGKTKLVTAMLTFGSIGLFVRNIPLASSEIALWRGIIGSIFLIALSFLMGKGIAFRKIKSNALLLILSGAAIGINWILLFEAYNYTTIPNATLSYYFAPVFVMVLAPFLLKEKLSLSKITALIMAMLGLVLIIYTGGSDSSADYNHTLGVCLGLGAAAFYASVVIMNKFIKGLSGFETTLIQLIVAALVLLPYVISQGFAVMTVDTTSLLLVLILGIVHTGISYYLYFSAVQELEGQTIAVLSYIDPISAVVFAALILGEGMSFWQFVGGALILCSTLLSEKGAKVEAKLSTKIKSAKATKF